MADNKNYRKRLTDAGGAVCVLTLISLILAVAGVLTEVIATEIYNDYYTAFAQNILSDGAYSFVTLYEKSMILAVLTLILFIDSVSAFRKKKLGWEFPALSIGLSIVMAVKPIMDIVNTINTGEFAQAWSYGNRLEIFKECAELSISVVPVFSCFFMLLAGLTSLGRFMSDDFKADVPLTKRVAVMPETAETAEGEEKNAETTPSEEGYIPYNPEDTYRREDGAEPVNSHLNA
jgi:hypothetical protein